MPWNNINVKVIIITFLFGLAVLFGGRFIYHHYVFNQPLQQVLAANPTVAQFTVDDQGPDLLINVHLNKTRNLQESYQELRRQVEQNLDGRPYQLIIEDDRDDALSQAYYASQFAVYEAIAQGNFREMVDQVQEQARAVNATVKVYVDGDYVYVQMENENGYLVEVIPRQGGGMNMPGLNVGGGAYAERG